MLKINKILVSIIIILTVIMSFAYFNAGHFLLTPTKQMPPERVISPVKHTHISTIVNNNKQEINVLEVNLSGGKAIIKPILSHDSVFGFEKLSSMVMRSSAYAAVNAGFFYEYGNPAGMVVIDGKMVTNSTGKYPVFVVSENKARLEELSTKLWIKHGEEKLYINGINTIGNPSDIVLYTRAYGIDNHATTENTSVVIENNVINEIKHSSSKVNIPKNGMVLTFYGIIRSFPLKEGESIEFGYEPYLGDDAQAYECGSWIVKNGQIVIPERDEWVGVMTNNDPRTAIGIKDDGTVVLVTVDGRQPEYSVGLKGRELGQLFLSYGVKNGAMLDGGASSEMILNGVIMNKPSFKGQERLLGGGFIVKK